MSKVKIREQMEKNGATIKLNTPITEVRRKEENGQLRVLITDNKGTISEFDYAVLACHADTSLSILKDPTEEETNLLSNFKYAKKLCNITQ